MNIILLSFGGLLTGVFSGLLGIGGGTILVPLQYGLLVQDGLSMDLAMRISIATSLLVIFPTVVSGAVKHFRKGSVVLPVSLVLGIFGAMGAVVGSLGAVAIPGKALKTTFAIVVILAGIRMLVSLPDYREHSVPIHGRNIALWMMCGLFAGAISSFVGIGGGLIVVPFLVLGCRFSMHQAVGTSTAMIPVIVLGGILTYAWQGHSVSLGNNIYGYLHWEFFWPLILTSIPGAYLGASCAHRMRQKTLRIFFVSFLFCVAGLMLFC